jgi:hypothetical protein
MSDCCGGNIPILVTRTSFVGQSVKSFEVQRSLFKSKINRNQNLIDYKALAKRVGISKNYGVKVGIIGSHSTIGQLAQSAVSVVTPGNLSPIRSPIRSGLWGAITPGKPNLPFRGPGRDRTSRCPEGYQYGGRFTDNRLSTCGQKLFDIPSPLGAAIGAIRRLVRGVNIPMPETSSREITGTPAEQSIVQSRKPQIPRVGVANLKVAQQRARELVTQMGEVKQPNVTRLVRRDGFVLEPVVSAQILRAIPDNRDMEGANYLITIGQPSTLGGQELGLLSNTGVTKLTYVLPGGSTVSLEKVRPLTVGERRKLGRTVNSAAKISVEQDATARLKEVVNQTGDGIKYSEEFKNIDNPNQMVSKPGKKPVQKWVDEVFGKGKKAKPVEKSRPTTDSSSAIGKKISNVDDAIEHINSGGSMSEIAPDILQQVLAQKNLLKSTKLDGKRTLVEGGGSKYILYTPSRKFEHIGQKFASDVQQSLGLESPDVFFVGKGENRKYLVQDTDSVLRGYKTDRNRVFNDYEPEDVARIMVADWLTDQRERDPGSIIPVSDGKEVKPVLVNNFTSGLTDLDKIKIAKRRELSVESFYDKQRAAMYEQYWKELKENQRFAFKKTIENLLKRARAFNFTEFRTRLYSDGQLTGAEKTHLEILETIFEQKVNRLVTSKQTLLRVIGDK